MNTYLDPGAITGLASPPSVPVPPDTGEFVVLHRVTVCGADVRFFHTTLVPEPIVAFLGWKQNVTPAGQAPPASMFTICLGTAAQAIGATGTATTIDTTTAASSKRLARTATSLDRGNAISTPSC